MAKKVLFEIEVDARFDDLNKLEVRLDNLKNSRKALLKIQKEEGQLNIQQRQRLTKLNQEIAITTKERSKLSRAVQENVRDKRGLLSQYEKESARLNRLRKQLKESILAENGMGKSSKKLALEVQKLDARLKKVDAAAGQFQRSVGNYEKGFKGLSSRFVTAAAAATGVIAGLRGIVSFGANAIKAAGVQEKAEKALEVALGRRSKALLDQASALQKVTKFGDEATIQAQAYLAQLGMNEDQILKLTPAIQDFAEAQGISLNDAAKLVAKSVGSSTNALSRYGISIEGAAGSNERAESAVEALSKAFGGQAEAAAKVGTGGLQQFQNLVGDLQEKIGGLLLKGINPFLGGLGDLTNSVIDFIDPAEKQSDVLRKQQTEMNVLAQRIMNTNDNEQKRSELITELNRKYPDLLKNLDAEKLTNEQLKQAISLANKEYEKKIRLTAIEEDLAEATKKSVEAYKELADAETEVSEKLVKLRKSVQGFRDNQVEGTKKFEQYNELLKVLDNTSLGYYQRVEQLNKVFEKYEGNITKAEIRGNFLASNIKSLNTLDNERLKLQREYNKSLEEVSKIQNGYVEETINSTEATRSQNEEIQRQLGLIEIQEKKISELQKLIKETRNEDTLFRLKMELRTEQTELTRLQNRAKDFIDALEETIDPLEPKIEIPKSNFDEAIKKFNRENEKDPPKVFVETEITDAPKLTEEQQKELENNLKEASFEIAKATSDSIFQIQKANIDRRKQYEIDQLEILSKREQEILQSRLDAGLISQAEYENNRTALAEKQAEERLKIEKENFNQKKKLDTAQALINGALAATKALANTTLPFPASLSAIAAIAGTTAIQVATIQAQKFAKGGLINGASHEQGGVPALVDGKRPIEVEGGEVIINKRSVSMFKDQLNYINQAGGGVPLFEKGGYIPKFANGGLVSSGAGINNVDLERQANMIIQGINSKKVINIASETVNTYSNAQQIENEFTL